MNIHTTRQALSGTCGVGLFSQFRAAPATRPSWESEYYNPYLSTVSNPGGADWAVAGFVKDGVRKEAYEQLKARFKIVFQSPVRRNRNSGNQFLFVVYDTQTRGPKPRWVGKTKGLPKPQALLDWENNPPEPIDNSAYSWPWK